MSARAIKRIIQAFGVLHLLFAATLLVSAGYCLLSRSVTGGWMSVPWLLPAAIYFFWLGFRGLGSPSPKVVRQICCTIAFPLGLPFAVLVEYMGWSHDLIVVALPAATIVLGYLWLLIFGSRLFCRRLFAKGR
jgi:hypothetical protein